VSKTDDLSTLFGSGEKRSWHTGVIVSWDELTGSNVVLVENQLFNDIRVLSVGLVQPFQPGDVVEIEVRGSQWFILGKVRMPGAGSAEQIRSAEVLAYELAAGVFPFGDLATVGPVLEDVYVGSSRRCLVTISAYIQVSQASARIGVQVSGSSTIAPATKHTAVNFLNAGTGASGITSARTFMLTAADGLNQGLNTFTAKYNVFLVGTGTGGNFGDRTLIVQPF
jgi:hypothetical protein